MKKSYILLKDSPELKVGAILEEAICNGYSCFQVTDNSFCKKDDQSNTTYSRKTVVDNPDWFEELTFVALTKIQFEKLKTLLGI